MEANNIEITFAIDMLWQEVSPDDYMADDTETAYADEVTQALHNAGYSATVRWSNVSSMKIIDTETGFSIEGDDYNYIRAIIDSVPVNYIEIENE